MTFYQKFLMNKTTLESTQKREGCTVNLPSARSISEEMSTLTQRKVVTIRVNLFGKDAVIKCSSKIV
ncbi:hypothetical protein [uncultured Microscilla sp.]|uniref:hypothetical protein n=1 Tax=uncultured Microscilla sp. TaxID=432653 RepID=UPI0026313D4C|nr:hypothetical protein [uncultured Microscilla sp.]